VGLVEQRDQPIDVLLDGRFQAVLRVGPDRAAGPAAGAVDRPVGGDRVGAGRVAAVPMACAVVASR
jgi:hypothetical protein